ncbi:MULTISPECIES: hypothetical protein [Bacillus cereus group]|uniref:hypothetical protein n=1 Tax=Bacillus TaxID=1386 RepID=UPI000B4B53DE|nr:MULTISPECIES: hypothetical protein [Bacillus cereus group]PFO18994.1 hypothetical protein COJ79_11745 [Bacillus thuringiensis]WCT67214.1 hypothetical protein PRK74_29360 [Bacillus cereus]
MITIREVENARKIKSDIDNLRKVSEATNYLFNELEKQKNYMLIGGAVRDLLFKRKPRDYDIVVEAEALHLNLPNVKRNSFGGLKVIIDHNEFDIWCLKDTWALKKMRVPASKENLQNSCFFNLDSVIYDAKNEKFLFNHFIDGINSKELDIIYEDNPYPSVCVIRAFVLQEKWEMQFSKRLSRYIENWVICEEDPIEELIKAQLKHYKEIKLGYEELNCKLKSLNNTILEKI